jgi:hypothetical protein
MLLKQKISIQLTTYIPEYYSEPFYRQIAIYIMEDNSQC